MTENRQPHVFALHHKWPYRYIYNMPLQWKFNICTCDQFGYSNNPNAGPYTPCRKCRKYNVYLFFKCEECEEFFLKDFRTPWFCEVHPLCWVCISKFENESCCPSIPKTAPPASVLRYSPPVGLALKMKFYTKEELAAPIEDFVL